MAVTKTAFDEYGLNRDHLLGEARSIALAAGDVLMQFYDAAENDPDSIGIKIKDDNSPVTKADMSSSKLIEARLKQLTPDIAVMSEENADVPDPDQPYWAIDPLDGTKFFINRTDGFAVNIALLLDGSPVLGVVNAPALKTLYYSASGLPAIKENLAGVRVLKTRRTFEKGDLTALFNKAHAVPAIYQEQRKSYLRSVVYSFQTNLTRCGHIHPI